MNYIVQKESLETVADSIRAKAGISEKLVFPDGWKAAVEGITGGAPDGSAVTFGYEADGDVPAWMEAYNGVLLPKIPQDVFAEYPYALIGRNDTRNQYQLLMAAYPWYYDTTWDTLYCSGGSDVLMPWYNLDITTAETATEWTFYRDEGGTFGLESRPVFWASRDIKKDSADSTEIYFAGSEPIPGGEATRPAEREERYTITSADLNELGAAVQNVCDVGTLLTVSEMAAHINGIQTGGDSSIGEGFTAVTMAVGIVMDIPMGLANSSLNVTNFTSTTGATGTVGEE